MTYLNHILVIEDDLDAAESLSDMLSIDGFQITTTASVQNAMELLEDQRFGVILTDRHLPDGLIEHRLQEILEVSSKTPVIVVTGYSDLQAVILAFRQGISDYVIKPIIPEDLIQTVRRILDRRVLEQHLKVEHAFAERIQSTAEAIILVIDFDGRVIHFNRFFTELTGWAQNDLIGENWFERCIYPEDRDRLINVCDTMSRTDRYRGCTNRIRCKNGEAREIRWSNSKWSEADGGQQFILAIGIDVSDLEEATQRAVRAERLAAIGETVAALAHESRNAIQRIKAAAEVLAINIRGNVDSEEELSVVQRAASDLSTLLESVRAFAAPIQAKMECADLREIWRRSWDDLKCKRSGRDVLLVENVTSCLREVKVDVCRMEQLFRNLFLNALEASDGPVRIEIDCECNEEMVCLKVIDDGPGLSAEQSAHLFEPFYTTKPTGTGLGMPICQRIAEAHGGTIAAGNHSNGTEVAICVPRVKAAVLVS